MNISTMRLTWLVSEPVSDKPIFKPVQNILSFLLYVVVNILILKYENLFFAVTDEDLWCSFPKLVKWRKMLHKNVSLVRACSVFNFLSGRDWWSNNGKNRETRDKNEMTKTKCCLNKSKFYSIFNINIQFSKTIGAAN